MQINYIKCEPYEKNTSNFVCRIWFKNNDTGFPSVEFVSKQSTPRNVLKAVNKHPYADHITLVEIEKVG